MDDFERRMQQSAEEVRQTTSSARPPVREPRRSMPGWLVFAGAFAAIVLLFGALPLWLGGDDLEPAGTTVPLATPTTEPPLPTTTPPPAVDCSSSGVSAPVADPTLPQPVAAMREAIIEAAVMCDITTLRKLADEGYFTDTFDVGFTTHFGGGGSEMLAQWEADGQGKLAILLELLGTDWAEQTFEGEAADALGSTVLYVWPAAFVRDTWEEITPEEMAELAEIYTGEELSELERFGSYAGWRTGITAEGDWVFFVAGD